MQQLSNAGGNVDNVISASVEIESELSEAEGYYRAMDVEYRNMAGADKRTMTQKVADYKEEYNQLYNNFQAAKRTAEANALKSGGNSAAARNKLLTANQKLDASTAMLESSRNLVHETEGLGNKILGDMESQKETLQSAQEKVKETKSFTDQARQVLRTMGNRAVMHKICVMFTILVLFGAICGLIYYKFIGSGKK